MTRNQLFRHLSAGTQWWAHRLTLHSPTLGLRLAARLGAAAALRPNSWRAPAGRKLAALFGPMAPARIRRIRRQIGSLESRNEMLGRFLRQRDIGRLLPLVTSVHAEPLLRCRQAGVPIVVVSWHQGPLRSVCLALWKLGVSALFGIVELSREPDEEGDVVRFAHLPKGALDARFLKRAHQALADGTVVGLNLDCATSGEPVSFLGRRILYGRGAASLARLAGARVVPVTRRFQGLVRAWR